MSRAVSGAARSSSGRRPDCAPAPAAPAGKAADTRPEEQADRVAADTTPAAADETRFERQARFFEPGSIRWFRAHCCWGRSRSGTDWRTRLRQSGSIHRCTPPRKTEWPGQKPNGIANASLLARQANAWVQLTRTQHTCGELNTPGVNKDLSNLESSGLSGAYGAVRVPSPAPAAAARSAPRSDPRA